MGALVSVSSAYYIMVLRVKMADYRVENPQLTASGCPEDPRESFDPFWVSQAKFRRHRVASTIIR